MSGAAPLDAVLGLAVRVGTVRIGEVAGVFFDERRDRVLGLEVSGPGGATRFVPWVAVEVDERDVRIPSALVVVDEAAAYERLGAVVARERAEVAGLVGSHDGRLVAGDRVSRDRPGGSYAQVTEDAVGAPSTYARLQMQPRRAARGR